MTLNEAHAAAVLRIVADEIAQYAASINPDGSEKKQVQARDKHMKAHLQRLVESMNQRIYEIGVKG